MAQSPRRSWQHYTSTQYASPGRIDSAQTLTSGSQPLRCQLKQRQRALQLYANQQLYAKQHAQENCSPHTTAKRSLKALAQRCAHKWQLALTVSYSRPISMQGMRSSAAAGSSQLGRPEWQTPAVCSIPAPASAQHIPHMQHLAAVIRYTSVHRGMARWVPIRSQQPKPSGRSAAA